MKKIFTLLALVLSLAATASTYQLKIINNTPYHFDYMMTTTPIWATAPVYSFPLYRQSNLITLTPFSSVLYDDPLNPGLPFNLFPGTWDYYPTSWSSYTVVSGASAMARDGLKQMWASIKFNVYKPGTTPISITSGHIGPFQSLLSGSGGGVTVTWIPSGTNVTVVIS